MALSLDFRLEDMQDFFLLDKPLGCLDMVQTDFLDQALSFSDKFGLCCLIANCFPYLLEFVENTQ
jgi:hypothetical protein